MFCVTSACSLPWRSSSTSATCPRFGSARPHRAVEARLPRRPANLGVGEVVLDVRRLLGRGVAGPHAVRPTEVGDARVGRDPRAGEHDDAARGRDRCSGGSELDRMLDGSSTRRDCCSSDRQAAATLVGCSPAIAAAAALLATASYGAVAAARAAATAAPARRRRRPRATCRSSTTRDCDMTTVAALSARHPERAAVRRDADPDFAATTGTVEVAVRTDDGTWRCQRGPQPARFGRAGTRPLLDRRSGDDTTPAGVFPLGAVTAWDGQTFSIFGNQPDPGTLAPYRVGARRGLLGRDQEHRPLPAPRQPPGLHRPRRVAAQDRRRVRPRRRDRRQPRPDLWRRARRDPVRGGDLPAPPQLRASGAPRRRAAACRWRSTTSSTRCGCSTHGSTRTSRSARRAGCAPPPEPSPAGA